jgi:outer membrane lipoprotein-sorting protein
MKKIAVVVLLGINLYAQSSLDIAKKSYEAISGYTSSVAQTTMILKNAQGIENIRKLEIKKIESKEGDKSLINFLYPPDIKETKLLSFEQLGEDDKQWLYLPALKRVKRISSSNKSGSFMASEFSYEDIASQNYENYSYEDAVQNVMLQEQSCFKITRIPKEENSAYSKQILYIDTQTYLAKFGEYYDKQNKLLKEISFLQYKNIDGVYRVQKIEMKNVQTGKSSLLHFDEETINAGLNTDDISLRALK